MARAGRADELAKDIVELKAEVNRVRAEAAAREAELKLEAAAREAELKLEAAVRIEELHATIAKHEARIRVP
jgi:hypothetical protein